MKLTHFFDWWIQSHRGVKLSHDWVLVSEYQRVHYLRAIRFSAPVDGKGSAS